LGDTPFKSTIVYDELTNKIDLGLKLDMLQDSDHEDSADLHSMIEKKEKVEK